MHRSLPLLVLIIGTAVIAVFLLWQRDPSMPSAPKTPSPPSPAERPPAIAPKASPPAISPAPTPPPPSATAPPPVPRPPPTAESPAKIEAETLALNLRHFGQRFGGNPVGTNAEIVKTLNGGNPQGVRYLPQENMRLNDQGELIDTWGTPYFFHQLSAQQMEIRSAGPDKTLWTRDDIVAQ